jgi:HEAT repeat protein
MNPSIVAALRSRVMASVIHQVAALRSPLTAWGGRAVGEAMYGMMKKRFVLALCFLLPFAAMQCERDRTLDQGKSAKEWGAVLRDRDSEVAAAAAKALAQIGRESIPVLRKALKKEESSVRVLATGALLDMAPDPRIAVPLFTESLQDDEPAVRSGGLAGLARCGTSAESALPSVIGLLGDRQPDVRAGAILTMGRIGDKARSSARRLHEFLLDESPGVREAAVHTLSEWDSISTQRLLAVLDDQYPTVRLAAASALWKRGTKAQGALSVLRERLLSESDPLVSLRLADVIFRIEQ